MFRSGREALPDVLELSGGPPRCPEKFERPLWKSRKGRETLPNVL